MSTPPDSDDPREEGLARLFEQSAATPTDEQRARLAAHASEVAKGRLLQRRLYTRLFWPTALAAAAAVAYLVVAPPHPTQPEAPVASAGKVEPPLPAPVSPAPAPVEPSPVREPEDVVATMLLDSPGADPFDLGPLMDDESD